MKKAAAAFVLVVVVAAASPVALPASGSPVRGSGSITIHTVMTTVAYTTVDVDRNGKPSVGDYSIAQVAHVDPSTGRRVGTGVAICTQVDARATLFDCQGSDVLPGGELREAGRFTLGKSWHLSILGGSGKFDGATGSVDGVWLNAKLTRSRDVFTVATG